MHVIYHFLDINKIIMNASLLKKTDWLTKIRCSSSASSLLASTFEIILEQLWVKFIDL
jgi:hypothetical protein